MRVLITGISGFAGAHLATALLNDGQDLYGTVHQRASVTRAVERIGARLRSDHLSVVDIGDPAAVSAVIQSVEPDAVLHLAGTAAVGGLHVDPATVFATNALGTLHLLAAVRTHRARARVVTIGSASAYGVLDPADVPVAETCAFRPVSAYGVSKAAADLIAAQWARAHDLDIVRVRPFNHIGPGQGLGFICPDVAKQLVAIERGQGRDAIDVGNVDVVRDFTDVRDVVRAYVAALHHGARGEAYNVCSGRGRSIREVIERMIALSGTRTHIRVAPERVRPADVPIAIGSPEMIERATGWQAQISLDQSLADVLADWRTRTN